MKYRIGIAGLEVVLVISLAFAVTSLLITAFFGEERASDGLVKPAGAARQATNYGILSSFDPFYRAEISSKTKNGGNAPQTALPVTVFGLASREDGQGSAIVQLRDSAQMRVSVGGDIADGVLLAAVYSDRIEIVREGVRETVLYTAEAKASATDSAGQAKAAFAARPGNTGKLLQALVSLKLQPVRKAKRLRGFKISSAPSTQALQVLSLETGDVLLSVNGKALRSFGTLRKMAASVKATAPLILEIERRGTAQTLTFDPR